MIHSNISNHQFAIGTFTRSEDMVTVRVANVPIYNGELLTTIGGSSEFLSAVSTQVQLSTALRNVSPVRLSSPSQTVENPQ